MFGTLNIPDNGEIRKVHIEASVKSHGDLENYAVVLGSDGKEKLLTKFQIRVAIRWILKLYT